MANRQKIHYKHRHNNHIDRQETKIDSIIRLTYALNRDVNKIIGRTEENYSFEGLNKDIKLDLISKTLLEMRDKLENYSKLQEKPTQMTQPNNPQNPNHPFLNQMPYNTYPFIPRIMF